MNKYHMESWKDISSSQIVLPCVKLIETLTRIIPIEFIDLFLNWYPLILWVVADEVYICSKEVWMSLKISAAFMPYPETFFAQYTETIIQLYKCSKTRGRWTMDCLSSIDTYHTQYKPDTSDTWSRAEEEAKTQWQPEDQQVFWEIVSSIFGGELNHEILTLYSHKQHKQDLNKNWTPVDVPTWVG